MSTKLITVMTTLFPQELAIIRNVLDNEGIYNFVQDELTAQVASYYTHAVGGAKLQVREEDVERTVQILKENGYLKDEDLQPTSFQVKLYNFFSRIPLIRNIYK